MLKGGIVCVSIRTDIALREHMTSPGIEIVSGLAGVLLADLTYRKTPSDGTLVQIQFEEAQQHWTPELIK